MAFENLELWWVTGAQLLYGGETVKIVDGHSKEMVDGLNNSGIIPIKVVYKGTANSSKEVEAVMKAANNDEKCAGIITWMHTFSPAKMWIKGLQALQKPLLHFPTATSSSVTSALACVFLARWFAATGRTNLHSSRLQYGLALQQVLLTQRTCVA
mgnify:CR=1 FL=1